MTIRFATLLLALAGVLWTAPALAQGPGGPDPELDDFGPPGAEARTRDRVRTMRAVALANHLDLDERQALKMNAIMRRFDEEREKMRGQMREYFRVLEAAAGGEEVEARAVEAALTGVMKGQARMSALRGEEFTALAANLDLGKKARLAIFLRDFPKQVRKAMRQRRGGRGRGPGGGGGPGPGGMPFLEEGGL